MLLHHSVQDFVEQTASKTATPGGGSVAAESGAIAYALAEMVAKISMSNPNCASHIAQFEETIDVTKALRKELLDDIDNDANSFNEVMRAKKLPKQTLSDQQYRRVQLDESYQYAAGMQLGVAEKILEHMHLFDFLIENGSSNTVTDALVGLMTARTAVLAALVNTKANLNKIHDKSFVEDMMEQVQKMSKYVRTFEMKLLEEHF